MTNVYDALDRRISRAEQQPSGRQQLEDYFHDGWDVDSIDQRQCYFPTTLVRCAWFSLGIDHEPRRTCGDPAFCYPCTTQSTFC